MINVIETLLDALISPVLRYFVDPDCVKKSYPTMKELDKARKDYLDNKYGDFIIS